MYGRRVNHLLHLALTVFTFGLWAIVWIVLAMTGGEERELVSVNEWGHISVSRLRGSR